MLVPNMSDFSFPHLATNVSGLFGLFVAIGGGVGYLQAGSVMSLYGGLGAGVAVLVAHLLCRKGYLDLGLKILSGVSLGLSVLFFKRFRATGVFFPAGFMALNSASVLFIAIRAAQQLNGPSSSTAPASSDKTK